MANGEAQAAQGQSQGNYTAEQALEVLTRAQLNAEQVLIMLQLFLNMSPEELSKLAQSVQGGAQQGQPQEAQGGVYPEETQEPQPQY